MTQLIGLAAHYLAVMLRLKDLLPYVWGAVAPGAKTSGHGVLAPSYATQSEFGLASGAVSVVLHGPAQQPFGNKFLAKKAETRRWAAWRCGSVSRPLNSISDVIGSPSWLSSKILRSATWRRRPKARLTFYC
jgi:hypothetical protein